MNLSMVSASVTMGQLQKKIDTISNNIANSNTTGFKRRDSQFSDLLFQQINNQPDAHREINRLTPDGIRVGSGAKIANTSVRLDQGTIIQTDRVLDLALREKGQLFQIEVNSDGQPSVEYTRDGTFYLSPNADNPELQNIVTSEGHYLLGNNGPITVPSNYTQIDISDNGQVSALLADGTRVVSDSIEVVYAQRPQLLQQMGDNIFGLPDLAALGYEQDEIIQILAPADVQMAQGSLEAANVDLGKEMSELLMAQRAIQFNSRSISMGDQMMGLINGIR